MRHGLGVLGWPPGEFWSATPIELYRGIEGWQECHNVGPYAKPSTAPGRRLTEEEVEELHDLMDMFPDD